VRLLQPSAQAFLREAKRNTNLSLFDRLHGYAYARWPYLYIGVATGEHRLARILRPAARWLLSLFGTDGRGEQVDQGAAFADTYHGKAVPLEQATQLVTVDEEIRLTDLEQVVPYARARDIVLKNPDHIVVLDAPIDLPPFARKLSATEMLTSTSRFSSSVQLHACATGQPAMDHCG
jgi:hypothetical protein